MAKTDEIYRDYVRRTHRTLATYLSLLAWTRGLECVIVERTEIVRFWGIARRVEEQRLNWLEEDVAKLFPYFHSLYKTKGGAFGSVFLSRKPFPAGSFMESMNGASRATKLTQLGLPSSVVSMPLEGDMISELASLIHGLADIPVEKAYPGLPERSTLFS